MSCIHFVVAFIYMYCLNDISQCNKEDAFVFTECNVTLEWNLGNDSSELLVYIMNPNGSSIIQMKNNQCTNRNNSSVKCIVIERKMEVFVSVIIINTTINDSGHYTAWIRKGFEGRVPISKRLTVIDKPQIMVKGKPILHESFIVTCNISFIHECLTFHWKIKGTDVEYTSSDNASKLKFTNLTTRDNSIKLECQVGMEKCVDANYAQHSCLSAESDTYMVLPYYGPYNVFFNLTDNNIYLRENASFIVKCYADCYPVCIFRWESYYMNVENEELVINRFESTMAGPYTCIARNRETNMTEKSRPVFLHHMKDFISVTTIHSYTSRGDTVTTINSYTSRSDSGQREELYWIGPVFLIVVFVILVTLWRIRASRGIDCTDSRRKQHPGTEQADSEVSRANAFKSSRALPCPPVQEDVSRRIHRLEYPKLQRHFRSLEKDDKGIYNQITETVPLQIESHSSDILDRQISDDLSDLTVYDYSVDNVFEETSQEIGRTEHYYYASSSDLCHEETADVHATDESYLHPISGLTYPLKTCQDDETGMNKTDQKYITIIDDFARPIEICQVEKSDVTETDPTYITPVT